MSDSRNKRGNVFDMLPILIYFVLFVMFTVLGLYIWNLTMSDAQAQLVENGIGTEPITDVTNAIYMLDWMGVGLFFGLSFVSMIGAYFMNSHPIFYIPAILVWAMMAFFSATLGNAMTSALADFSELSSFPKTEFILNNLALYALINEGLIIVSLFAKPRNPQGGF